ncbi:hypothetical protein [Hymenobacter sp. UYP22]|uniref:hypothetical protein n=1 Tax=Hymenobacter sp. UYP22 TaxID=3156348 RepID=UPI00339A427E
MKRILHSVALASLLGVGAVASGFSSPPTPALHRPHTSYTDYQDGYANGKRETEQNKCIDGANFPERYESYRQRVLYWQATATTQQEADYYQGYLDGMEDGYNTPVVCGSPGGGGGPGTGPGGGGDGPIDPVFD